MLKKYEIEIPSPSKFVNIAERFPKAICMLVDAYVPNA